MNDRDYLKKLWAIFIGSIAISVILYYIASKLGLVNKLLEAMQENIILTMLILVPVILNSITNMTCGLAISGYPDLLDGIQYNRIAGLLPIYNAIKVSDTYYSSEECGIIGRVPVFLEVIMSLFFIGGLVVLFFIDGFYIFSYRVTIWVVILYALFFINSWVKSIVIGKATASFDDIVPFNNTKSYYIIPLISGLIVIIYFVMVPVMVMIGMTDSIPIKYTLANTLAMMIPFALPIYSMIISRRVISYVKAYYARNF